MNCIYCGKPVMEHEAGVDTDRCIASALGRQYELDDDVFFSRSQITNYVGELKDYLTDIDGPVENLDIRWERDRYRNFGNICEYALKPEGSYIIDVEHWMQQPDDVVDKMSDYTVTAETLPLALCRAVLWLASVEEAGKGAEGGAT